MAQRTTVLEQIDDVDELGDARDLDGADMLCYRVVDLDQFFEVYGYTDEEKEAIRRRWQYEQLYVHQDGSATWGYGDSLIESDRELLDEDQFIEEAEAVGELVE